MSVDFSGCQLGAVPGQFRPVSGTWTIRNVNRSPRNDVSSIVVESDRHVAFPGICRTHSGALLTCYREAYTHASGNPDDGRIMVVRSVDDGKTWSDPELAYDDPTMDDRNAAVSCMSDGTIALIWDKYLHGKHHWAWISVSADEGRPWSEPRKMTAQENVHTRSRGLDLGDGTWLLPWADAEHGENTATYVSIYDPSSGAINEVQVTPTGRREMADEIAVTRAADGTLVALIRSPSEPTLWQVSSADLGRTWTTPVSSGIPSQFTPCDLLTLRDGRIVCSFSFRERRNERVVVSRDHGASWDIESSVDVFAGTESVGGDRSYPASVQLDDNAIGTVLYETQAAPVGGRIYFVRTPIDALSPPTVPALYCDACDLDRAAVLWPEDMQTPVSVSYRFTGLFGAAPHRIGLVMDDDGVGCLTAFEFQMGTPPDVKAWPTNQVRLVRYGRDETQVIAESQAAGGWYNDGNDHSISATREGNRWQFALDGTAQLTCEEPYWRPRGIVATRAAVAVYGIATQ